MERKTVQVSEEEMEEDDEDVLVEITKVNPKDR